MDIDSILSMADREEAFLLLAERYASEGSELRSFVREGWDFDVQWEFPNPSRLACRKHEKSSCEERIKASLVYEVITSSTDADVRDNLVAWAVIYQSCCFAGIDPDATFKQVARLAPDDFARRLNAFIARQPEDKSLEAFMLQKHINADGETEILLPWQQ